MKFFVPASTDNEQAERVYQSIREFVKEQGYTINDSRIYSITFDHNGNRITDTVGEVSASNGEHVVAIFDAGMVYLVCTLNSGVARGAPMMAGKNQTVQKLLFEFPAS